MADYNGFKKIDIYSSHTCLHPNPLSHCIIYIWRYQLWPHMLFASCDYIFRYHLWLHDGCYLNELMGYASWFNHQNGKGEKIGSESEIGIFKMNNRKNRIGKKIHIGLTLIISYNFEPSYKFLYFYKIPIISYKLDIAGIFSTRMHQNEYRFSKIFRGCDPRIPDLYRDPAVMPTLHAVLLHNLHTVMCPMSDCSTVSRVISREMTVCSKVF